MSSFSDPKAIAANLAKLGDLVQAEVMDVMDAHEWRHGTPAPLPPKTDNPPEEGALKIEKTEAAPVVDNPPKTVEAKVEPVVEVKSETPAVKDEIDWDALRDPTTGKYMGKYADKTQAAKGIANAVNMAKQAYDREATALKRIAELEAKPATTVAVPIVTTEKVDTLSTEPVKSEKLAKVLAKVSEDGGILEKENLDDLLAGISEQAGLVANQIVEKKMTAKDRADKELVDHWDQVSLNIETKYPGATQFVDEMSVYIKSNPLVQTIVNSLTAQGKDFEASEYVWLEFQKTLGTTLIVERTPEETAELEKQEIVLQAKEAVRKEAVEQARKDAGVIPSITSGVHETPEETYNNQNEINAAARVMNQTGQGKTWRSLAYKDILKDIM